MMNPFFEQKNGEPGRLDGRMTAYAIVEGTEGVPAELKGMIREGSNVFAVQADCRQEQSVDDFFKTELGSSLKKGLDQVIQRLRDSGLWGDQTSQDTPKEDMNLVRGMAELIPIMARIVSFESEEEVLSQDGDIYYLGRFSDFQSASMCAQAFSLLYQFRYREQERGHAKRAVEDLLSQIESDLPDNENFRDCKEDLEKRLFGSYVPAILYSTQNEKDHKKSIDRFRRFMNGYRFPEDVDEIVEMSKDLKNGDEKTVKRLELLLKKVVALSREDFGELATIQRELNRLSQ